MHLTLDEPRPRAVAPRGRSGSDGEPRPVTPGLTVEVASPPTARPPETEPPSTEQSTQQLEAERDQLTLERDQLTLERDQLVEALVAAQDRLGAMVALMQVSGESLDLTRLTELMLAEALELTASDYVALHRSGEELLCDQVAYDDVDDVVLLVDGLVRQGLPRVGTIGRTSYAVLVMPDSSFSPGGTIGVGRQNGAPYSTGDLRMVETVAAAVEQLTRMARLHREAFRRLAFEREHQLASALAQAVMPRTPPTLPGVDLFSVCRPAAVTGGDLLVLAEIGGTLWFAVGDVAGKGLPAATIMTRAVAAIRVAFLTHPADRPGHALQAVAEEIGDDLTAVDSFITLALGTYTPGEPIIRVASAGHSPVVLVDGATGVATAVPASVPPLGVTFGLLPDTEELAFGPGSRLVIGTDGLVEQPDPTGAMRTYEDFIDDCTTHRGRPAGELGAELIARLDAYADGTDPADDQTLLVVGPGTGAGA
ncbi:MAG: hypothetical protein JWP61_113 [Friedmanniella sp.]|nr:hypothetical protein [Friedmanniella sp.]